MVSAKIPYSRSPIMAGLLLATSGGAQAMPFISEFHYDNASTDVGEAIEITAPAGTDLSGWSVVLYNGSNGEVYDTRMLNQLVPDCGNGDGVIVLDYPTNGIQNGSPDGIALVDGSGNVTEFLSYEGSFTAVGGPADTLSSTDILAAETSGTPVGASLQLSPVNGLWSAGPNSFGLVNGEDSCDGAPPPVETAEDVRINELHYDNDGSDTGEAIELTGEAGLAATGWTVILYNGSNGTPYDTLPLTGTFSDFGNGRGSLVLTFPSNGIQNGSPDGLALVNPANEVTEFLSYEGSFQANGGAANGLSSTDIGVAEAGDTPVGQSLQRCPDSDTWQSPLGETFGAVNNSSGCELVSSCSNGSGRTPIYEIQGAGHVSPLVLAAGQTTVDFFDSLPANDFSVTGEAVVTSGIVTAVDSNGFYLQDPAGDGDDATSDALFVFTGGAPGVAAGDEVEVEGEASEFFPGRTGSRNLPITQVSANAVTVCSSDNSQPAATVIGSNGRTPPASSIDDDAFTLFDPAGDGADFFESLEGMLVTAEDLVAVSGTSRFGEIFAVVNGGASATGLSSRGTLNIAPDDFNPEKIQVDEDSGILDFDFPAVDTGATIGDVTGVISLSFGNYEILPTVDFTANIIDSTLQPESTDLVASDEELTVASYNVLNLDPNDDDGDTDIANGRFDRIARQIVDRLNTPDIIGLQEVQDDSGSADDGVTSAAATLQQLVDAIAAAGGPGYTFIDNTFIGNNLSGGQPGGNIRTAFLYNPSRVSLDGTSVQTIGGQGSGEAFEGARLPLVATFKFDGESLTVINNHFSSKGGSAPLMGIEQDFTSRQEEVAVNGSLDERQRQSGAVQTFVEGLLGADEAAAVVVLGDLNEFEFISPVTGLEAAGLTNLTNTLPDSERYTFIFQGNSQSLDHILVSPALAGSAQLDAVRINAEFVDNSARASDHDPLVVALSLASPDLPGDIDGDGDIDRRDWRQFLRALGSKEGSRRYNPAADFDGDGFVSLRDFFTFIHLYANR